MSRNRFIFRKRWVSLAAIAVVLAVAVAAGSMFAANSGEQPVQEAAAAQAQPDLTDPGLYAAPQSPSAAVPEPGSPPQPPVPAAAVAEPNLPDPDPGVNQVVPEGSGALAAWLSSPPPEMGFFSTQEAMVATDLDVAWMLYEAVATGGMTQDEADAFRAWFDERPTVDEAPELLNHLSPEIQAPAKERFSGNGIRSLNSR